MLILILRASVPVLLAAPRVSSFFADVPYSTPAVSSGSNNSFLLGSLAADTKSGCLGWIGAGVDTGVGDLLAKLIHLLFVQN